MAGSVEPGENPVFVERRRHERRTVNKMTRVTLGGRSVPCRLMNISAGGALIAAELQAPVGTEVILDIPGGEPAPGKVVRVTSIYTALQFETVIDLPADF